MQCELLRLVSISLFSVRNSPSKDHIGIRHSGICSLNQQISFRLIMTRSHRHSQRKKSAEVKLKYADRIFFFLMRRLRESLSAYFSLVCCKKQIHFFCLNNNIFFIVLRAIEWCWYVTKQNILFQWSLKLRTVKRMLSFLFIFFFYFSRFRIKTFLRKKKIMEKNGKTWW